MRCGGFGVQKLVRFKLMLVVFETFVVRRPSFRGLRVSIVWKFIAHCLPASDSFSRASQWSLFCLNQE